MIMKTGLLLIAALFLLRLTSVSQPLSGSYTVGYHANQSYNFSTIQGAIDSLELHGVNGAVIIQIDSGIYNEMITVDSIPGTSPNNTVTFTSLNGDSSEVIIRHSLSSSNDVLLKLLNTEYINIQKISFVADGTGAMLNYQHSTIIETSMFSNEITLNNCNLMCTNIGNNFINGINIYGQNITINNNLILNPAIGIIDNSGPAISQKPIRLINNQLINFKYIGISGFGADSIEIVGNHIETNIDSISSTGIFYAAFNHSFIEGNTFINTNIGLFVLDGSNFRFSNNFISINRPNNLNIGIHMGYQAGGMIDFNTINIISGDSLSSCIRHDIQSDFQNYLCGYDIKNNIFKNSVGPIFDIEDSTLTYVDYNILECSAPTLAYLGVLNTTYPNLASLQQNNKLINCVDTIVYFNSNTDLHLASDQFSGLGAVSYAANPQVNFYGIQSILFDIDHDLRNQIQVRPGADEYIPLGVDLSSQLILKPNDTVTYPNMDSISVVVKNNSSIRASFYQIKIDLSYGQSTTYTIYNALLPFQTDTLFFPAISFPPNNFIISAKTIYPTDTLPSNDSISKIINVLSIDIGLDSIIKPLASNSSSINNEIVSEVQVNIHNYGDIAIDTIPLCFTIMNNPCITDTLFKHLLPNDTASFTFHDSAYIKIPSDSIICVNVNVPFDIITTNDGICKFLSFTTNINTGQKDEYNLQISPNPNHGSFTLKSNNSIREAELSIYNAKGELLINKRILNKNIIHIQTTLSPGYYFLSLQLKNGAHIIRKLVIL